MTTVPAAIIDPVASLERFLGDPRDPSSRISFAESLELDEREALPLQAIAALDAWGMQRFYVPEAHGGALRDFETLSALVRAVARRDLTVAIAHAKTFLGVAPVWLVGTPAQRDAFGSAVCAGAKVALGLTEEAHGADLFATETTAAATPSGYTLSGEKWLINNATLGEAVMVFARTDPRGGPRGFSLFLVSKRALTNFTCLPKIPTHGIRGADISGIRFEDSELPPDARIGAEGHGVEVIMKSLQISRTLVPALSLGALEMGLREVMAFARARRVGGRSVLEIPHARRVVTEAFVDLVAAEVVCRAAARSIHVLPERLTVWSAVLKYLIPTRADEALRRLAVVLGARHYLRGSVFEKLLRDHGLVALFDGSTVVNLNALALELPRMSEGAVGHVGALYDLHRPVPPFRPERLEVINRGGCDGAAALSDARARIEGLSESELDADLRRYLLVVTGRLITALEATIGTSSARERASAQSPEGFATAERYARLHAATTSVLAWVWSRHGFDDFFARGEWLGLALWRLVGPDAPAPQPVWYERVFERLDALDTTGRAFVFEPRREDVRP